MGCTRCSTFNPFFPFNRELPLSPVGLKAHLGHRSMICAVEWEESIIIQGCQLDLKALTDTNSMEPIAPFQRIPLYYHDAVLFSSLQHPTPPLTLSSHSSFASSASLAALDSYPTNGASFKSTILSGHLPQYVCRAFLPKMMEEKPVPQKPNDSLLPGCKISF